MKKRWVIKITMRGSDAWRYAANLKHYWPDMTKQIIPARWWQFHDTIELCTPYTNDYDYAKLWSEIIVTCGVFNNSYVKMCVTEDAAKKESNTNNNETKRIDDVGISNVIKSIENGSLPRITNNKENKERVTDNKGKLENTLTANDVAMLKMFNRANFSADAKIVLPSGKVIYGDEMQALTSFYSE